MNRFPDRVAGSTLQPFQVALKTSSGAPRDLTGDSALWTIRRINGKAPVVDAQAHTNTPGVAGVFEYRPSRGEVSEPGEYIVTVDMTIGAESEVVKYGLRIVPAF